MHTGGKTIETCLDRTTLTTIQFLPGASNLSLGVFVLRFAEVNNT